MTMFVKLLAVVPFKVAVNAVPSGLKRSTRTVRLVVPVFAITISVDQPPPAANCGSRIALGPPIPAEITGTGAGVERFVTGKVLKFQKRKRNPTTEIGLVEVI